MSDHHGTPSWQRHLLIAWQARNALSYLLWPISQLYKALVSARFWLYRSGFLKSMRLAVPVVVVGNVVAGGSGKTPVVIALVQHLQNLGIRVAVVSRGYGRTSRTCLEVTHASSANEVGDEPLLIHRRTGAAVCVAASRTQAAQSLLAKHPDIQIIISDDGLQHLRLHRDVEIGVFDDRGVGNGWLLPAGPLREPWPRPLDLVLNTGEVPRLAGFKAQRTLAKQAITIKGEVVELQRLASRVNAKPLMAVAAIGQPAQFFDMLAQQGLHLAQTLALPDHDDFQRWSGATAKGHLLLCTEKDAVKLWAFEPEALAVPLMCTLPEAFYQLFSQRINLRCPSASVAATLSSAHGHTTT